MGLIKGGFLRLVATLLYFLGFICSIYIMAATAWFIARFRDEGDDNNDYGDSYKRSFGSGGYGGGGGGGGGDGDIEDYLPGYRRNIAIIVLSAIATLYTSIAMLLTCCLAGIGFFAVLAFIFDIIFVIIMIVIAILTRSARFGCGGFDLFRSNPFGAGLLGVGGGLFGERATCRIYVGTFALAIIAVFVFIATAAVALLLFMGDRRERVVTMDREPKRSPFNRRPKTSREMERPSGESAREI